MRAPLFLLLGSALLGLAASQACVRDGEAVWVGRDGLWSDTRNWCSSRVPRSTDTVIMRCSAVNCTVTLDVPVQVDSIRTERSSVFLLQVNNGLTLRGASDFDSMNLNSFIWSVHDVTVRGAFRFIGGEIYAPMRLQGDFEVVPGFRWRTLMVRRGGYLFFEQASNRPQPTILITFETSLEFESPSRVVVARDTNLTISLRSTDTFREIYAEFTVLGRLTLDFPAGSRAGFRGGLHIEEGARLDVHDGTVEFYGNNFECRDAAVINIPRAAQNARLVVRTGYTASFSSTCRIQGGSAVLENWGAFTQLYASTYNFSAIEANGGQLVVRKAAGLRAIDTITANNGYVALMDTRPVSVNNMNLFNYGRIELHGPTDIQNLRLNTPFDWIIAELFVHEKVNVWSTFRWQGGRIRGVSPQMEVFSNASVRLEATRTKYLDAVTLRMSENGGQHIAGNFYIVNGASMINPANGTFVVTMAEQFWSMSFDSSSDSEGTNFINFGQLQLRPIFTLSQLYLRVPIVNYGNISLSGGLVQFAGVFHNHGGLDLAENSRAMFVSSGYRSCISGCEPFKIFFETSSITGRGIFQVNDALPVSIRTSRIGATSWEITNGGISFERSGRIVFPSTLTVRGGTLTLAPDTMPVFGDIRITAGTVVIRSASWSMNTLVMSAGVFQVDGNGNIESVEMTGGTWTSLQGTGSLSVRNALLCGRNTKRVQDVDVTFLGNVAWQDEGDLVLAADASFIIANTSTFSILRSFLRFSADDAREFTIINLGTIVVAPTESQTGTITIFPGIQNRGLTQIRTGSVVLEGGFVSTGRLELGSSARVTLAAGAVSFLPGSVITNVAGSGLGSIECWVSTGFHSRTLELRTLIVNDPRGFQPIVRLSSTIVKGTIISIDGIGGTLEFNTVAGAVGIRSFRVRGAVVNLNTYLEVLRLDLESGRFQTDLDLHITEDLQWAGGALWGTGEVLVDGQLIITGDGHPITDLQIRVAGGGMIAGEAGSITFSGSSIIENLESSSLLFGAASYTFSGTGRFVNRGSVELSIVADNRFSCAVDFENIGNFSITSGQFLSSGFFVSTGRVHVNVDGVFQSASRTSFGPGSFVTGNGELRVTGDTTTVSAASFSLNVMEVNFASLFIEPSVRLSGIRRLRLQNSARTEITQDPASGTIAVEELSVEGSSICTFYVSRSAIQRLSVISSAQLWIHGDADIRQSMTWSSGFIGGDIGILNVSASSVVIRGTDHKRLRKRMEVSGSVTLDSEGQLILERRSELVLNPSGSLTLVNSVNFISGNGMVINFGTIQVVSPICPQSNRFLRLRNQRGGFVSMGCSSLRLDGFSSDQGSRIHLASGATLELASTAEILSRFTGEGAIRVVGGRVAFSRGVSFEFRQLEVVSSAKVILENAPAILGLRLINADEGAVYVRATDARDIFQINTLRLRRGTVVLETNAVVTEQLVQLEAQDGWGFGSLEIWDLLEVTGEHLWVGGAIKSPRRGRIVDRRIAQVQSVIKKDLYNAIWVLDRGAVVQSSDAWTFSTWLGAVIINNGLFDIRTKLVMDVSRSGFFINNGGISCNPQQTAAFCRIDTTLVTQARTQVRAATLDLRGAHETRTGAVLDLDADSVVQFRNRYVVDEDAAIVGQGRAEVLVEDGSVAFTGIYTQMLTLQSLTVNANPTDMIFYLETPTQPEYLPSVTVNRGRLLLGSPGSLVFRPASVLMTNPNSWDWGRLIITDGMDVGRLQISNARLVAYAPVTVSDFVFTAGVYEGWQSGTLNVTSRSVWFSSGMKYLTGYTEMNLNGIGSMNNAFTFEVQNMCTVRNRGTLIIRDAVSMVQAGTGGIFMNDGSVRVSAPALTPVFSLLFYNNMDFFVESGTGRIQNTWIVGGNVSSSTFGNIFLNTNGLYFRNNAILGFRSSTLAINTGNLRIDVDQIPVDKVFLSGGTLNLFSSRNGSLCLSDLVVSGGSSTRFIAENPLSVDSLVVSDQAVLQSNFRVSASSTISWSNGQILGLRDLTLFGSTLTGDCITGQNLLASASCDDGDISGWTQGAPNNARYWGCTFTGIYDRMMFWSGSSDVSIWRTLTQEVDVSSLGLDGVREMYFECWARSGGGNGFTQETLVEFLDASRTSIGTLFFDSLKVQSTSWRKIRATRAAPSNTRFVRVRLTANYFGYWDNFFLGLARPPFITSEGMIPSQCYTSQGLVQIKRTEIDWAQNVCGTYTNCVQCAADTRCGWSGLSGQCEEGTPAGPRHGVDCNWIFEAAKCPAACSSYTRQDDCESNICTWCPTLGCQQRGGAACRGEVTLVWNNPRGGLLEDANNWLPAREPTSSDILLINIPGDYTVFTNQDSSSSTWLTVRKIIVNNNRGDVVLQIRRQVEVTDDMLIGQRAHLRFDFAGHLRNAKTLTVQGRMFVVDWSANLFGAGAINVFGFLDMNRNGAFFLRDGKTLTVFGRSVWNTGYRQSIMENSRLVFASGSSNFVQGSFEFNTGTGSIVNEGEIVYSPMSTSDSLNIYYPFTNTGVLRVERGFFRLYSTGTHSGQFNISTDGVLALMGSSQSITQVFNAPSTIFGSGAFQCGPDSFSQGVQVTIDSLRLNVEVVHIRACRLTVSAVTVTSPIRLMTFGWYNGFAQFVSAQRLSIGDLRLEGEGHRVVFGGDVDVTTSFRMTTNTILDGSGAVRVDTTTPSIIYGGIITGTAGRVVTFGSRTMLHIEPQREIRFTRVNMTANCDVLFDNHNSALFLGDDFRFTNRRTFFYNGTGHDTATTGNGLSTTINEGRWIVNMDVRTNWFNYISNFVNFGEINVMSGRFSLNQGGESFGIIRTADVDELSIRHFGGTFIYRVGSRTSGTGTIQFARGTTEIRGEMAVRTLQVANDGLATIFEEAVISGLENLRVERNIFSSPQATLTLRRPITVPNAEFLSEVRVNVNAELRITNSLRHSGHIFASRNVTVSGRSFFWGEGTINLESGAMMDLRETPTDFTGSGDRVIRGGNVISNALWRSTHLSWFFFETGAQLLLGPRSVYSCDRECRINVRNGGVGIVLDGRLVIDSPGQSEIWSTIIANNAIEIRQGTLLLGGRVLLQGSLVGGTLRLHGRQSIVFTNTSTVSLDSLTAEGDTWSEMLPIAIHSASFAVKSLSCPMPFSTRVFQIFSPNTTLDYLFTGSSCDLWLPSASITIPRVIVRARLRFMNNTVLTSSQFFIEESGNVYSTASVLPLLSTDVLRFAGGTINSVNVDAGTFDLRTFSRGSFHMYLTSCSVFVRQRGSWQASNQWINVFMSRGSTLTIGPSAQVNVEVPTTISGSTTENFVVLGNISYTHLFGDSWVTTRMINRGFVSITRRQLVAHEMLNIDGRVDMTPSAQLQFRERTSSVNQTGLISGGSVYHFSGRFVCQPRSLRLELLTVFQGDVDVLSGPQDFPIAKDVLVTSSGRLNVFARIEVPSLRQIGTSTVIRINRGGSLSVLLRFEWTSGWIQGAASNLGVVVPGRVVLSDTNEKVIDQAFLEVRGSGAWTQGQITLRNAGELRVNPGAKFDLVSTSPIAGQGTFNNGGDSTVQACGSTVQISVALINSGNMNCRGNLRLNAGGTNLQGGKISLLTPDTVLEVFGGTLVLQDFSDVSGDGNMDVTNSAIVSVGGGVANVGLRLLSTSARLTVTGDTNMTRSFDWKAGIVSGSGVFSVHGVSTWDGGDCQGVVEWHNEVVVGNRDTNKFVTGVMIVKRNGVLRHGAGNIIVSGRFTNDIGGLVSCEPQGVFSFYCTGSGVIQNIGSMVVQAIEGQQYTLGSLQNFGTLISRKGLTRLSGNTRLNVDSQLAGAGNFTCTSSDNLYLGGSIRMTGYLVSETCNMYIKGPAFFDGRVLMRGGYLRYNNPMCQAYYDVFNPQSLLLNPCPEPELIVRGRLDIDCSTFTCDFSSGASLVNEGEIYYTGGTWSLGERFENNGLFVLTDGRLVRGFRQSPAIYNNKNGRMIMNAPPRGSTVTTASVELAVFNEGDLTVQGLQRTYIECLRQTRGSFNVLTQFDTSTSDASCRTTQFAGGSVTGTGTFIRGLNCTGCRLAPGPGVLTVNEPLILNQAQYEVALRARVGEDYDILNVTARASMTNSQTILKIGAQFSQVQEGDEFAILRFTDAVGSLDKPAIVLGTIPGGFTPRMVHRPTRTVVSMSRR